MATFQFSRRPIAALALAGCLILAGRPAGAQRPTRGPQPGGPANLAPLATPRTSYVSTWETLSAINDDHRPRRSNDTSQGGYGNYPEHGTQWVEYVWDRPISTRQVQVYWYIDGRGLRAPSAARVLYWDGDGFVPVEAQDATLGTRANVFNDLNFKEIKTTRLRLEIDPEGQSSTGVLEWRVLDSGDSTNFPPRVRAAIVRKVVGDAATWLGGSVRDDGKPQGSPAVAWSKVSGPGAVRFANASDLNTSATFSAPGDYLLRLTASDGAEAGSDTLRVAVVPPPPADPWRPVLMRPYSVDSPLWDGRVRALIVNWIPHCIDQINDPNMREGGIVNFIEAANKVQGKPYKRHQGNFPFTDAWTYNTIEAMAYGLMVDAKGDPEILRAQATFRKTLDDWIPKIVAAQEPDGYLQTAIQLSGQPRWTNHGEHEGYAGGYLIEAGIADYIASDYKDDRLYKAARKLADCWAANLGPAPKQLWWDGHEEMEQALTRLAAFVDRTEGPGKGQKYMDLAKFLLDSRGTRPGGGTYDQTQAPVTQQYEAVGHAVRAVYLYSGMTDVAMATGDRQYLSAIASIWDNLVNGKYYVTGGVGSGETSEGFGDTYSLPNNAYCESCSGCGELFFQHKMSLATHDGRYADLAETTLYNAILSDIDLAGNNFTYTNPLDTSAARYAWHSCPCCVGNIPRTLLELPTWAYARSGDGLVVNMYLGSTMDLGEVAGADLRVTQQTDYPWSGKVALTFHPSKPAEFAVRLRVPNRQVSTLYHSTPQVDGLTSMAVNGENIEPKIENGYALVRREWKDGDTITLELPMPIQQIHADPKVAADRGLVALRRGPIVYNIEAVDNASVEAPVATGKGFEAVWKPELLGGVTAIEGKFADGKPLLAIPNYVRNNRGGRSLVWMRDAAAE